MATPLVHPPVYSNGSQEIVDDSEPERAALRRQGRRARTMRDGSANKDSEVEILSAASTCLKTRLTVDRSVIDISDSGSEEKFSSLQFAPTKRSTQIQRENQHPGNAEASTSKLSSPSLLPSPAILVPKTLDLSGFAFKDPPNRSNSIASVRDIATLALPTPAIDARRPCLKSLKTFDVATTDFAKISRCVTCELAWTTRKTAVQKMAHIRSCAKKNKYADKTVRLLLQKAIADHAPTPAIKQSKGESKELVPTESPKDTYMDGILVGAGPRKKAKRGQPQCVLTNISVTRDGILERAKAILATKAAHDIDLATSERNFDRVGNDNDPLSLVAQTFGQSTLAQGQNTNTASFFSFHSSPTALPVDISDSASLTDYSPDYIHPSPPEKISEGVHRTELQHDLIQNASGLNTVRMSDSVQHSSVTLIENVLQDHDTTHKTIPILTVPSPSTPKKARKPRTKSLTKDSDATANHSDPDTAALSFMPTKRSRKKKTPVKAKVVFNEKWEAHMTDHIHKDTNLYLRVLRYEPIDFNIFLAVAQHYAPVNGRLKLHLRAYLDDRAIHFYEASRN